MSYEAFDFISIQKIAYRVSRVNVSEWKLKAKQKTIDIFVNMPVAVLLLIKMNWKRKKNKTKNKTFHFDSQPAIECERASDDVECFSFRRYQNIFLTS